MENIKNFYGKNKTQIFISVLFIVLICFEISYFNLSDKVKQKETEIKLLNKKYLPCDSLKIKVDSLETELFILNTELTRHEITREEIFYKYPKVGEEYQYFITNFTE
jgi:hypothetical protein